MIVLTVLAQCDNCPRFHRVVFDQVGQEGILSDFVERGWIFPDEGLSFCSKKCLEEYESEELSGVRVG